MMAQRIKTIFDQEGVKILEIKEQDYEGGVNDEDVEGKTRIDKTYDTRF